MDLALNNKSRDIVFCIASFLYSKSNQNYIPWSAPKRLFCYHLNNLRFCGRDSNTKTAACERYALPEKTSRWLITPWVLFYELTSKYGDLNIISEIDFTERLDLLHAQTSHRVKGQSGINLTSGLSLHSKQMAATKIYANKTETFCVFKRLKRFKSISIGKFYACWMWLLHSLIKVHS